ncbi:MAG: Crp/Fnr family transcriptional regulator [Leptospira sp.]|nr:Crp/Fnr family transcriptional regulator [Leptospira sp.]
MDLSKELEFLHQVCNAVVPISKSVWNSLPNSFFTRRILGAGEFFLREGKEARELAILVSGVMKESYQTSKGDEYVKSYVFPGEFTGSYYDLLSQKPSTCSIRTLQEVTLYAAPFSQFIELSQRELIWKEFRLRLVESLFCKKAKREFELLTMDAKDRYLVLTKEKPELESFLTQKQLASYLRITPVSLSRIKNSLKKN